MYVHNKLGIPNGVTQIILYAIHDVIMLQNHENYNNIMIVFYLQELAVYSPQV